MKISKVLVTSLVASSAVVFGSMPATFAGEGGAAGSAAFRIEYNDTLGDTMVTGAAVSAAVGKNDAAAGAFNDIAADQNSAFALGSSGAITLDTLTVNQVTEVSGAADATLGTGQANEFVTTIDINLDSTGSGTVADFN